MAALPAAAAAAPWTGRTYPAKYDLRAHGRVTRVGLQDHYGTCWIFAAVGSLESCLLPGARLDLSENHMADFQGSRLRFEGRAPSTISTAYVARWEGPVLERDDPYPHPGRSREGLRAVRHVQEVLFLPPHSSPRANDAIKWAVMRYGAVDATMAYEASGFNAATSAYYSRGTRPRPPRLRRRLGRRVSRRAVPAAAARPRRVPHQEQLGHELRAAAATSGSPTTTAPSGRR